MLLMSCVCHAFPSVHCPENNINTLSSPFRTSVYLGASISFTDSLVFWISKPVFWVLRRDGSFEVPQLICFDRDIIHSYHEVFLPKGNTPASNLGYLAPQGNFSWVPNCSFGLPECETKVSAKLFGMSYVKMHGFHGNQ